jgi:hypothetical protein
MATAVSARLGEPCTSRGMRNRMLHTKITVVATARTSQLQPPYTHAVVRRRLLPRLSSPLTRRGWWRSEEAQMMVTAMASASSISSHELTALTRLSAHAAATTLSRTLPSPRAWA